LHQNQPSPSLLVAPVIPTHCSPVTPPPPQKQPKPRKPKAAAGGEDGEGAAGPPAKKPRKKKDPNAPKKALSAFMYFSNKNRERVKAANPGVAFGQVRGGGRG
jgi:hypothetical protein